MKLLTNTTSKKALYSVFHVIHRTSIILFLFLLLICVFFKNRRNVSKNAVLWYLTGSPKGPLNTWPKVIEIWANWLLRSANQIWRYCVIEKKTVFPYIFICFLISPSNANDKKHECERGRKGWEGKTMRRRRETYRTSLFEQRCIWRQWWRFNCQRDIS